METNESSIPVLWRGAAIDLGVEIEVPFELTLASGKSIRAPLFVRHFGAVQGMLVLSDYSLVSDSEEDIINAGFGFSVFSEPDPSDKYVRDEFIEVLEDWGWYGPESDKPEWLNHLPPLTE